MIVLDSSFLIGFYNERDAHHSAAAAMMERFLNVGVAARVGKLLLEAEELEFVPCSDLFNETLGIFAGQGSTRLSLADAAIAHVARQRAGGLVLTFDEELGQAAGIRVPQA